MIRDFEEVYATQGDPWSIGDADSERYDLYFHTVLEHATGRRSLLDIGCGYGAFLGRFRGHFERLVGVELAHEAVRRAGERRPFIDFRQGSAARLEDCLGTEAEFDFIVFSDVLNYLGERDKERSLRWQADHLAPDGRAFIAAWSPGGTYLTGAEMRDAVARHLAIEEEGLLGSEHAFFVCRPRRRLVALTVDYETWQPVPPGRAIDWERDVFEPTDALLSACGRQSVRLTLMAELGEFLWLVENDPARAARMESQWAGAVAAGHDVQLHLHPAWLPELGARRNGDEWMWDPAAALAHDYPGDLGALIVRCSAALQRVLSPVNGDWAASCYRAGAYEAQPFERLWAALTAAGIRCDASVYPGGSHPDRHYDYSLATSTHQPWFAARYDPQLSAPPAEEALVELPVFTPEPGLRWTFDGTEGNRFAERVPSERDGRTVPLARWAARRARLFPRARDAAARLMPGGVAYPLLEGPAPADDRDDFFVLVGHTKSDLDVPAIERGLAALKSRADVDVVTLAEMSEAARAGLDRPREHRLSRADDATPAEDELSRRLMEMVPLDRRQVLDLRPADLPPSPAWASWGHCTVGSAPIDPLLGEEGPALDCVFADRVLELSADPQALLERIHGRLGPGGVLVAAVHSDARNPGRPSARHRWRTAPSDVLARLRAAGFARAEMRETNVRRHGLLHPPSLDRLMLVRAWRGPHAADPLERADQLIRWTHGTLDPAEPAHATDALEILSEGMAWCSGATAVLGEALSREGFAVRWVTMIARNHPRGRGPERTDSHEVVEVRLSDGSVHVLDPTANRRFPYSIEELLHSPGLAAGELALDPRHEGRGYELYSTPFWYERVSAVAARARLDEPQRFVSAGDVMTGGLRRAWRSEHRVLRAARVARQRLGALRKPA